MSTEPTNAETSAVDADTLEAYRLAANVLLPEKNRERRELLKEALDVEKVDWRVNKFSDLLDGTCPPANTILLSGLTRLAPLLGKTCGVEGMDLTGMVEAAAKKSAFR